MVTQRVGRPSRTNRLRDCQNLLGELVRTHSIAFCRNPTSRKCGETWGAQFHLRLQVAEPGPVAMAASEFHEPAAGQVKEGHSQDPRCVNER